jgi:hypothetical protein
MLGGNGCNGRNPAAHHRAETFTERIEVRQLHSAVVLSIAPSHISGAGQLFSTPKFLLCAAIAQISLYVARKPEIFTLCGEAVKSLDRIAEKIVMNQCFAFQLICHPTDADFRS